MIRVSVFYARPHGARTTLLAGLHRMGAHYAGVFSSPRVPIEVVLGDGESLEFATRLACVADGWSATLGFVPLHWVQLELADGDLATGAKLLEDLAELGEVDFGVCTPDPLADPTSPDEYRAFAAARITAFDYRRHGPLGLGRRTLIGPRLVKLMDQATVAELTMAAGGWRANGQVRLSVDDSDEINRIFLESGIVANVGQGPLFRATPGSRWVGPPTAPRPREPEPAHAKVIGVLRATMDGGTRVARNLEAERLVAPFAALSNIRVKDSEFEGATLSRATTSGILATCGDEFADTNLSRKRAASATIRASRIAADAVNTIA